MVSATTSAAMPSGSSLCGTPTQYDIPNGDAACGVPKKGDHVDLMKTCCNGAPVVAYDNDCAVYCLAYKQSVEDLTNCLYAGKIPYQDAWCNKPKNATATQTNLPSQTSSAGHSSSSSPSKTSSGSSPSQTNAAPPAEQKSKANMAVSIIITIGIIAGVFM
ncbi:uncharacterized protein GIQ15_06126 [Arthroderma uncinatum]|uniref:uncharacterized protein n=1 Tax=Arthroderma uncinatum TaxID=74035 RepID=UPI00144ACE37|nr:uncharacterized protein GIQ15_06126 [Arthroderma uncinatum]KAF3480779.1 hypothetical protein GIQ15_06126 [Arthroderma uncinatum]